MGHGTSFEFLLVEVAKRPILLPLLQETTDMCRALRGAFSSYQGFGFIKALDNKIGIWGISCCNYISDYEKISMHIVSTCFRASMLLIPGLFYMGLADLVLL